MIETILIANRGEIACRIMRTCRRLGIRTVAVYSDADADALHVQQADEAVHIGPSPAADSYLIIDKLIDAAQRSGADAIHPGFGFLAENADFARACADAGLIFIGPDPAAIAAMGNKRAAKDLMDEAGVPTISGYNGADQSDERLQQEAARIGYPLMVKAAAGGGGKGMRIVSDPADLPEALAGARREAGQAFGSDELMLERAVTRPRHVEFQVIGDQHGRIIHLGERECSIQRRHQKVIEETPSTALTPDLRAKMGETAVRAAQTLNYHNAGTVEMLLGEDGSFYFLEINTRLQVEHPVTEMVTGIDLVEWQIRIAEGEPLPLSQEEVTFSGHAVEARLYAEDPANGFLPVTGPVLLWQPPAGEGVRVDAGIQTGDVVSIYYDPMLAKLIAQGPDRKTAVRRLKRALETAVLLGLTHNLRFLRDILRRPAFLQGDTTTGFIAEQMDGWRQPEGDVALALIAATLIQFQRHPRPPVSNGYWRNNPNRPEQYRYEHPQSGEVVEVSLQPLPRTAVAYRVAIGDGEKTVSLNQLEDATLTLTVDGRRQTVTFVRGEEKWWVQTPSGVVILPIVPLLPQPHPGAAAAGSLRAPMPGSVLAVLVNVGDAVSENQPLMKLEAMKMEHTIRTAAAGVVEAIYFQEGDTVEADAQLLQIGETTT